jgi:hypothetical protein
MKRLLYRDGWSPLTLALDALLIVLGAVTTEWWLCGHRRLRRARSGLLSFPGWTGRSRGEGSKAAIPDARA